MPGKQAERALRRLHRDAQASCEQVERRRRNLPRVTCPASLPISERVDELAAAITAHPVVVVCGETGSGKSTQLPKVCLQAGLGTRGLIGHTQPRRLAARSIAARISEEIGQPLGGIVGFKVRFNDRTGPDCRIKVMTDGILLAETQQDRWLRQYDALIIDEAHERSLNIDFLLGYLKKIRSRRPELRLVITSATIDPERFSEHFDNAPIISVSGRGYPVEDRYRPLDEGDDVLPQTEGILAAVEELAAGDDGSGDILVFLAGEREIRETADALRKRHPEQVEVLPLFARLSAAEQDRIFRPAERRRIVLATNIAETSLTVPRIRYVVDPGLARISRYSYRSKIQRLMVEPISKASADQRRGRCGRERDGTCIRLYSEEGYLGRPEFTDPEIRRTNLASVILQMECSRLGRIEDFPFIDPPDPRYVSDGYRLLRELGAVDGDGRVTPLGRSMAAFPLDPRLGRIVVAAAELDCLKEILPVVSLLSIQDPRERPLDAREKADEAHRQWHEQSSDVLGIVALWECYLDRRRHLSVSKQRIWCRENFLSFLRMREWYSVHQQLLAQVKDSGQRLNRQTATAEVIHRAFLSGMLGHIGQLDDREYSGARGSRFLISPGSALRGGGARWVVAASLIQTDRVFAHTVAQVRPEWIEQAAGHLVKKAYEDPHWDEKRGHVVARERVSLYGLVLAANRRVDYGRVNPAEARRLFVAEALADDRLNADADFARHNRAMRERLHEIEAKLRRRDLLADRARLEEFFDERVPAHVMNRRGFERWRRKAETTDPKLLFMSRGDLLAGNLEVFDEDAYPDHLTVEGNPLRLEYRFEPGDERDGVTIIVPRQLLPMLDPAHLEWLVPGYLEEKITAMIRALPKPVRRRLVPAPDVARRCLSHLDRRSGLATALATALTREAGVPVEAGSWLATDLPSHLVFNFRVVDSQGGTVAESRDLDDLQARFGPTGPVRMPTEGRRYQGMTDWQVGELPRTVATGEGNARRFLFPALHDDGDSVSLVYYASRDEARSAHRDGTLRLFRIACRQAESYLRKEFGKSRLAPLLAGLGHDGGDPVEDLVRLSFLETFLAEGLLPLVDRGEFDVRLAEGRGRVVATGIELGDLVERVANTWRSCRALVAEGLVGPGGRTAGDDIAKQLQGLVFPGWLRLTPVRWLREFPRYLSAVETRIEKIQAGDQRVAGRSELLSPWMDRLKEWEASGRAISDPVVAPFRWMLEEYRVSLFDQRLGTSMKVSPQRLERQWREITRGTPGNAA